MTYTPTNTFVAGNLIVATEVNTNFTQAATAVSNTSTGHDHDGSDSKYITTGFSPLIHVKSFSAATEVNAGHSGSWVDLTSFNLSTSGAALLTGMSLFSRIKCGSSGSMAMRVVVSGVTTGTYYTQYGAVYNTASSVASQVVLTTEDAQAFYTSSTSYQDRAASIVCALPLTDASVSIKLQYLVSGANDGYYKDTYLRLMYANYCTVD